MALCSSAYNPLTQFMKYSYEDRGLQRDKLISRRTLTGRQGFRTPILSTYEETESEYRRFHSTSGLATTQDLEKIQPYERRPEDSTSSNGFSWCSEFKRGGSIAGSTALDTKQCVQNSPSMSASYSWPVIESVRRTARPLGPRSAGLLPAGFERSELASSPHLRFRDPPSRIDPSRPAMDRFDWDGLFESLDTSVREPDLEYSATVPAQGNHENIPALTRVRDGETVFISPRLLLTSEPQAGYKFQFKNPFNEIPNPFEEGLNIISNDGNLSLAALAFEAACQLNPTHFEAWSMLGSIQSENDREGDAISALKEALELDSQSTDVMMKLAVAYTNEGQEILAYEYLERWLKATYPLLPVPDKDQDHVSSDAPLSFEKIRDSFIRAAQLSLATGKIDPDVQVGLGVLLFSEQSYEMAADCFAAAIHSSEPGNMNADSQLHLLWNRYGACLGNEGRHEDAIEAYEMALAIRPNFVRARYNLGLLYHSKNDAIMGARNILQALQAYKVAESKNRLDVMRIVKIGAAHGRLEEITERSEPKSFHESLKRCCNSMGRWDLANAVGSDMDLRWFQKELESQGVSGE